MNAPPVPRYGRAALSDLPGSVLAALGVPGAVDVLGLPELPRACVLVVDGLGLRQLRDHPAEAPFLTSLDRGAEAELTAGFPATTVTSLGSLGTGLAPGGHGLLGLTVAVPGTERMLNLLFWGEDVADPERFQPAETTYARAAADGVEVGYVSASAYRDSPLSRATTRGARYLAADGMGQLVGRAERALQEGDRAYITVYHPDLDATGHRFGVDSPEWRHQLRFVDLLAERIAAVLPSGAALYVTADHGMTDPTDRVDIDTEPELSAGVARIGGDARARYLYTADGAQDEVLAVWRERLGDSCWIAGRDEAASLGWFGPLRPGMLERVGDVVAVPHGPVALVASEREPWLDHMVGMHGSMVPEEQLIPLLTVVRH